MIIQMLTELGRGMDKHSENLYPKSENIKKNTIIEIKITQEEINSRLDETEE